MLRFRREGGKAFDSCSHCNRDMKSVDESRASLPLFLQEISSRLEESFWPLTRRLIATESPSGDTEGSARVVALLAEAARNIEGIDSIERITSAGYGEHLRVRAFAERATERHRTILLLGHTDTVHPRGSLATRPWREEDGKVFGPGIFDMKANCALALEALRACAGRAAWPQYPVTLLLTCDEETGSLQGGRELVEEEAKRAAAVLVLEPSASGGRAKTARKGTGMFTIRAEGRAAHAGLEPEKGASAVREIARQIERVYALADLAQGTTLNVGVVRGGTRSNVVAEEASAEVDARFLAAEEAQRIERALFGLQPFDERVSLKVTGQINRPPLERTEAIARLYQHARRLAALLDWDLGETSVGGASDGNFAAAAGAPVLDGLGIAGDGAHAAHEHIIKRDVARRGALLAALLSTL